MNIISRTATFAGSPLAVFKIESGTRKGTLDTSLVLFFLAVELGQSGLGFDLVSLLSLLTLAVFLTFPYFLASGAVGRSFGRWIAERSCVAAVGLVIGTSLGQVIGTLLPDMFKFVPMSMLIVASIICCNIQIYGILRNRLAR